ncbi:MAG: hypothetical protein WCR85_00105 [Sphaerochaeta sp.]
MRGMSTPARIICMRALENEIVRIKNELSYYRGVTPKELTDWEWVEQQEYILREIDQTLVEIRDA